MSPRIAIVGGGIAGALLAWRLSRRPYGLRPDVYTGELEPGSGSPADATGASGGLVRGFEPVVAQCREAAESLAELLAEPRLRAWADFREVGSVYVLRPEAHHDVCMATVEAEVPGSARVVPPQTLASTHPFRRLPDAAVCIVEDRGGYLSPGHFRGAVLQHLAAEGLTIRRDDVATVMPDPAVCLSSGTVAAYDVVVVAAGAWTPALLRKSGLPADDFKTKQIQYSLYDSPLPGLGAFVDETSGLYGRSDGRDGVLLGLPCEIWDADPAAPVPDAALARRVRVQAAASFGPAIAGVRERKVVVAVDCYADEPGLRLRRVLPGLQVYTFTAGSGASAKTALAASRIAAAALAG